MKVFKSYLDTVSYELYNKTFVELSHTQAANVTIYINLSCIKNNKKD